MPVHAGVLWLLAHDGRAEGLGQRAHDWWTETHITTTQPFTGKVC